MYIKIEKCSCFNGTILAIVLVQLIVTGVALMHAAGNGILSSNSENKTLTQFSQEFGQYRAEKMGLHSSAYITEEFFVSHGLDNSLVVDLQEGLPSASEYFDLLKRAFAGEADIETLSLLFDTNELISWYALTVLSGTDGDATIYFDPSHARFGIVPHFETVKPVTRLYVPSHPLLRAISSDPRTQQYLWSYVNDVSEFRDDAAKAKEIAAKIYEAESYGLLGSIMAMGIDDDLDVAAELIHSNLSAIQSDLVIDPEESAELDEAQPSPLLKRLTEDREAFLKRYPYFQRYGEDAVRLSGWHRIREDVIIPRGLKLIIAPGVHLRFEPGVSLVSYGSVEMIGKKSQNIILEAAGDEPWGAFVVLNATQPSEVQWVKVSGGSSARINGGIFQGMVSFHDSSVIIADSAFDESTGESALSLKNVYTDVQRVHFTNNQGVGLVIDRSPVGTVKDAAFIGNINGGLTLTQSQVSVIDTSVDGGVHCMKIARKSVPQILESTVRNCDNGIIVQDDAHATVEGGIFEGNTRAIEAHKENEYFAAPSITVTDSTFLENGEQYSVDGGAVVSIE